MKAVHQAGWGGREQLSIQIVPRPAAAAGCVLVKVVAISTHAGDAHMLSGRPYLVRLIGLPKIPGMDFAGVVEELGEELGTVGNVAVRFAKGDEVFGTADAACGAFAEYVAVPSKNLARKPENVSWGTAAAIPTSGMTALQALRAGGEVTSGQRVLVNGASGGVGTFAVQLAKAKGAHVTGVCSTANVDTVRSLGADEIIDYKNETVEGASAAAGVKYDKIIDAVGRSGWRPMLAARGALVAVALPNPESELIPCQLCSIICCFSCLCCCLSSKKSHMFMQSVKTADLEELAGMASAGTIRPLVGLRLVGIDKIPDALAGHSDTLGPGHRLGKTVAFMGSVGSEESPEMERF